MMYTRLYKSFQKFIDQDEHFTELQQDQILESFKNERNKKVFQLSIILLVWSIVGITLDSLIIGGSFIGIFMQGLSWKYILPTVIFSVGNFVAKVIFIHQFLKKQISFRHVCLAGIPYVGSASIIAYLLRKDPLYGAGLQHYSKYLRKRGFKYVCCLFKKSCKNSS